MMTMLAMTTGEQVLIGSNVIMALVAVLAFSIPRKQKVRMQPPPLQDGDTIGVVPKGRRFNAHECDGKHKTLEERMKALEQEKDRIYDRIDEVHELGNSSLNQSIEGLRETIRRLPGEIIDLLKKTGQLRSHND